MRHLRTRSIIATAAAAVICALACTLLPGPALVRLPFALALLLVLPGFAIWCALFPDRPSDPLRTALYSVGLSTVVGVFGGVEMGAYGRLSTASWAVLMAAITLIAAAAAYARLGSAPAAAPRATTPRRVRVGAIAAGLATLLVIGAAVGLARTPLPVPEDRGYTVLAVDPLAGDAQSLVLRITSEEARARLFSLEIRVPGSDDRILPIEIDPGQTIEKRVALPPIGERGSIRALLVDESSGERTVYRRVRIGLPVPGPAPAVRRSVRG